MGSWTINLAGESQQKSEGLSVQENISLNKSKEMSPLSPLEPTALSIPAQYS